MSPAYHALFQLGADETPYRKLATKDVRVSHALGREILVVERETLRELSEQAMIDINHLLRPSHLAQLAKILDDPEASANDKFVAYDLLKNANIAATKRRSPRASATPTSRRTCATVRSRR